METVDIDKLSVAVQYYNRRQFKGGDKLGTLGTGCGSWSGKQAYSIIQLNNPTHSNNRLYSDEGKSPTLNTMQGGNRQPKIIMQDYRIRKLTPVECERLQTVPDNFTDCVSNSQRYKILGNGRTVELLAHIFSYLRKNELS